jgi:hypothetical protein
MSSVFHDLRHPRKISQIADGEISIYGSTDGGTVWAPLKVDSAGRISFLSGLIPHAYDYASLSYTGSNLTGVVYRTGGSGGTVVATLALTYNVSDDLETITKT